MGKRVGTKAEPVKSIDDLDFSEGQPAEIVIESSTSPDDLKFEGGPLDGLQGDEALRELGIEKETEAEAADDGKKEGETSAADKAEGDDGLPELEIDPTTGEPIEAPADGKSAGETQAFEPNLKYKVYDEEKEFPEWAKGLVASKETEDELRTLFSKADALEPMQERQRRVVEERDTLKSATQEHVAKVNRLVQLREQNPAQFFEELGVSDDHLIRYVSGRLATMEDAQAEARYQGNRATERNLFAQQAQQAQQQQTQSSAFAVLHQQAMDTTMSRPEVSAFKSNFERVNGAGSFDTAFRNYGSMLYQSQQGRYAPPHEVADGLMKQFGHLVSPQPTIPPASGKPAPQTGANAQPAKSGQGQPAPRKERPKTIPKLGGAANVSPTSKRPRSFEEMEKKIAREI